jgi:exonuclease V gamma subunit
MLQLSESLESLLDQAASDLAQIRDPRARHWLVFPQPARSGFVMQAWARKSGIASHAQTVELRTLLEQIAADGKARFQFDALKLAIAAALPQVHPHPGSFLPEHVSLEPITPAVLEWAGVLAQAMDDTLLARQPNGRWEPGSFLHTLAQHPTVKPILDLHLGNIDPTAFNSALDKWMDSWERRGGVPHLWIQMDSGLPQIQCNLLVTLYNGLAASHPERLHLYVLSPTAKYWADAQLRAKNRKAGFLNLDSDENPSPGGVLWAFGRSAQALHRQLSDTLLAEGDGGQNVPAPEPPRNILGWLQLSCREAEPFSEDHLIPVDPEDRSFTVHSCRSTLRELENCRDRILQALEEDPGLRPEEIVVLLANPEEQAPLVEAAFRPEICPYRLLGFGKTVSSPLATGLELLFEVLQGRVTHTQIQSLLEHPLIAARFGFQPGQAEMLDPISWLRDAQFFWGVDAQHRQSVQSIDEARWNLTWALQRLGLGAILPTHALASPLALPGTEQPIVPLERAAGLGLAPLAAFALFASRLAEARILWNTESPRPLSLWLEHFAQLCDSFFDLKKAGFDSGPLTQVVLHPLRQVATGCDPKLTSTAFQRLLQQRLPLLSQDSIRGPGGICIADLRHYSGVPARMIVVAGLNDDTFPARDDRPEWHPLSHKPATGDPSRREADRHALLLTILAARERLVLSYLGGSDADAKTRPPSTALADLFQILDAAILAPNKTKEPHKDILISHTLNGFSPTRGKTSANHHTYLASDRFAANLLQSQQTVLPYQGLWSTRINQGLPDLTLRALETLLTEPAALFVRSLHIRLPEEAPPETQGDLIQLDGLGHWKIREALLPARLEATDETEVLRSLNWAGHIPRGRIGDQIWVKVLEKLPKTPQPPLTAAQRFQPQVQISLPTGPVDTERRITGQIRRSWYLVAEPFKTLVHYSVSQDTAEKRLPLFLEAVCIAAALPEPLDSAVPAKLYFQNGKPVEFTLPAQKTALDLLSNLLPLFDLAHTRPLPFWPGAATGILVPKPGSDAAHKSVEDLLDECRENWEKDGTFGTPGEHGKPATRLAFRGCPDPFSLREGEPATAFLPDPNQPLAWRIAQFLRTWCGTAGFPLSKSDV